jgi:hypothetical protein
MYVPCGVAMLRSIHLESLNAQAPTLTQALADVHSHCCTLCFHQGNHYPLPTVSLDFIGKSEKVEVRGLHDVTDEMWACYADQDRRVDLGACAIALLLMPMYTGLVAVGTSAKGDGVDYYLAEGDADDHLIFNRTHVARLEVSGIQSERLGNTVNKRIAKKRKTLEDYAAENPDSPPDVPTYICLVEFGQPKSKVVIWPQ